MGFRRNDLQEAFFVPGDHAFRVWGFSTTDCLADVLRPGYFTVGALLHLGELIYVRMQAQPPARLRRPEPEPVQMALLMVVRAGVQGQVLVRLVQDFGHTDAPADVPAAAPWPPRAAALAEPPARRRGRPAGSRTRKAPATNGHHAGPPVV